MSTLTDAGYRSLLKRIAVWSLQCDNIIPERVKMDDLLSDLAVAFPKNKFEQSFEAAIPTIYDLCVKTKDAAASWLRDCYEPNQLEFPDLAEGAGGMYPVLAHYLEAGVGEGKISAPTLTQLMFYAQHKSECASLAAVLRVTMSGYPELFRAA
jgi:hypothetical protein